MKIQIIGDKATVEAEESELVMFQEALEAMRYKVQIDMDGELIIRIQTQDN